MRKLKTNIYIILLIVVMALTGCAQTQEAPVSTPTQVPMPTAVPTPTPTPSPTPVKFAPDIVDITDEGAMEEFDKIEDTPFFVAITQTEDVVLVEFWSENVTYCVAVSEALVTLSENTGVKIVRVNVDDNPTLADDYGVVVLPSVYVFKGGIQVNAVLGAAPIADYDQMVQKYR